MLLASRTVVVHRKEVWGHIQEIEVYASTVDDLWRMRCRMGTDHPKLYEALVEDIRVVHDGGHAYLEIRIVNPTESAKELETP